MSAPPPSRGGRGDDEDDPLRIPQRANPYQGGAGRDGGYGGGAGVRDPLRIGGRDIVPPGFPVPGGPRGLPFGGGGSGMGGGMLLGPNDPFFAGALVSVWWESLAHLIALVLCEVCEVALCR